MLKKILIGLVVVIGVFLAYVAKQPSDFRITRSAVIAAPAKVVFAQVNDFHNWQAWSPWAKKDPTAKNLFEGSPSGKGAMFSWAGNREVGEGRMTITESHPYDLIRINLDFSKPMKASHTAEFRFAPEGKQTTLTWSMFGKQTFMGKAICLFMNMDKMVGGDFEKGLAEIKTISESARK